jgi:hypothetical protein
MIALIAAVAAVVRPWRKDFVDPVAEACDAERALVAMFHKVADLYVT